MGRGGIGSGEPRGPVKRPGSSVVSNTEVRVTRMRTPLGMALLGLLGAASASGQPVSDGHTIEATAEDGVKSYGEVYPGDLGTTAPVVLLFHQGGSNGRGEYGDLAPWLNGLGFRVVAWDQRAGGDTHGSVNRTAVGLRDGARSDFCSAYADLAAALDRTLEFTGGESVVVWGSSYSAALVFRLAAERPDAVSGVLAFSPASGGPMAACRARQWVETVDAPMLVLRPEIEMGRDSSIEQRDLLTEAGARFEVVEHGVHGSSMLVDDRTGRDMSAARSLVGGWLRGVVQP